MLLPVKSFANLNSTRACIAPAWASSNGHFRAAADFHGFCEFSCPRIPAG